jgi:hypothetical protein
MTPLKTRIVLLLKSAGPLSDFELLGRAPDEETGGLAATIVICCLELQNDGVIEPTAFDPNLWQLSNRGLDVAERLRGGVYA